jgi:hypothetical protein
VHECNDREVQVKNIRNIPGNKQLSFLGIHGLYVSPHDNIPGVDVVLGTPY